MIWFYFLRNAFYCGYISFVNVNCVGWVDWKNSRTPDISKRCSFLSWNKSSEQNGRDTHADFDCTCWVIHIKEGFLKFIKTKMRKSSFWDTATVKVFVERDSVKTSHSKRKKCINTCFDFTLQACTSIKVAAIKRKNSRSLPSALKKCLICCRKSDCDYSLKSNAF